MDIRMAVGTTDPDIPEIPLLILFVACEAGDGEMSAFEGKYAFIMPLDGKGSHRKALNIVAGGAVGSRARP